MPVFVIHFRKFFQYFQWRWVYKEILLPKDAPAWMADREKLWNAVELGEKRKDAQLAREATITLPRELSNEQNIALAKEFVQKQFVDKGMVADLCFHNHKNKDGEKQPHVHVMLSMREVTQDGFGLKVREWNEKPLLELWREEWANVANKHLALAGIDQRIDHRSNEERGIPLEPQYKIGSVAAQDRMARMEDHQRIARENGNAIFLDPNIALDAITRQQSTFTEKDLAKFINRHTEDAQQFQQVFEKVKASEEIVRLGFDNKQRERLTTKEMLELETSMLYSSELLSKNGGHEILFNKEHGLNLSTSQEAAFEHLIADGDLKCVVGFAGTGKSYLLNAARIVWKNAGYSVKGATLSGIAAENLEAGSDIKSKTVASYIYNWDRDREILTDKDILVIDEAGMLGSRQVSRIIKEVEKSGAKVVCIGDIEQLQAIDAGAAFRAIANHCHYVQLTEIRRQELPWQKEATKELALGKTAQALDRFDEHNHLHCFATQQDAREKMIEMWNDVRISQPQNTQIMLAYTNKDVQLLNECARNERKALGELGDDRILNTTKGQKAFAVEDRIYFLKNDKDLGVKNGTLGTIKEIADSTLSIKIDPKNVDDSKLIKIDLNEYNHITHGYAATVHKAQGLTVDRSYFLPDQSVNRHITYTGLSRHKLSCDIFYSNEHFRNQYHLINNLSREQAKDLSIDYIKEFAKNREISEQKPLTIGERVAELGKQIHGFEEELRTENWYKAQKNLDHLISTMANSPIAMERIRAHDQDLAKKIEDFSLAKERQRTLELERDLER